MAEQDAPTRIGDDPTVERLLRLAGPRDVPGDLRRQRVRVAVRAAWQETVRERTRRTWFVSGVAGLAAAAALVLAAVLRSPTSPPADPAIVARVIASTSPVRISAGGMTTTIAAGATVAAGATLETAPDVVATLTFEAGGEVRFNGGTQVRLLGPGRVALDRGHIYLDSGGSTGAAFVVETFAGSVRDVGTRFDVRVRARDLRVRVREGAVRLEAGGARFDAGAGRELIADASGTVDVQPAETYGGEWDWILRGTSFTLEGATLGGFLDWIEIEGGRSVEFVDPAAEAAVAGTVLHGSISGLTTDQALDAILPTCGLTYRATGSRIQIDKVDGGTRR